MPAKSYEGVLEFFFIDVAEDEEDDLLREYGAKCIEGFSGDDVENDRGERSNKRQRVRKHMNVPMVHFSLDLSQRDDRGIVKNDPVSIA